MEKADGNGFDLAMDMLEDVQDIYRRKEELEKKQKQIERLAAQNEYLLERLFCTGGEARQRNEDKHRIAGMQSTINQLEQSLSEYRQTCEAITNSTSWKLTKPLRRIKGGRVKKTTEVIPEETPQPVESGFVSPLQQYVKPFPSQEVLDELKKTRFPREPLISILVPLYNTPKQYLKEMIESVTRQTYPNWELCFADGSDREHAYVGQVVQEYASKDGRIKYKVLEENKGISENTNRCIEMAIGEFVGLLDHDDILHPAALYQYVKAINEQNADFMYCDEDTFSDSPENAYLPHFKPDFAIDNLRANNYICHFSVFSRALLDEVGWFRSEYDGSQDFDLVLRLAEKAKVIVHIPEVLYYWRAHQGSVALRPEQKLYAYAAAKRAIESHLEREGISAEVENSQTLGIYKIQYELEERPLISIIIPNKDLQYLEKCICSIETLSTYKNYEIIVVENNSSQSKTFRYYEKLPEMFDNVKVVYSGCKGFNYSKINNEGAKHANGKYLLFLNNDMEVITPDWMEQMLMYAQREDVGAVGAKLYYEDGSIQHAGVCLGLGGVGAHVHAGINGFFYGYMGRLLYAQDFSAVTAACLLMKTSIFNQISGFDERFAVEYNDVDLCMRIRKAGYLVVFTPYAELYHYESKTRGRYVDSNKDERHQKETKLFYETWGENVKDPYYNPNLPLDRDAFAMCP